MTTEKKKTPVWVWVLLVAVGLPTAMCAGAAAIGVGAAAKVAANPDAALKDIHSKVAEDTISQYEIAKRSGSTMDACVRAGLVAESFLQAKDEANFQKWKATEKADCAAAGLPK